uniref:GRB2 n=1 Tax=Panagrolaimus sp. ES5 TaxID=591445 RepID=A0AC34FJN4_9BILA
MEAIANYKFTARFDDELSVDRGDIVKVLDKEFDRFWYKAEMNGLVGIVPKNYFRMLEHSWYKGKLTRAEAAEILLNPINSIGAFLIRNSETEPNEFSLSVKYENDVRHFKVLRDSKRGLYYLWTNKFNSLNELIAHYRLKIICKQQQIFLRSMKNDSNPLPFEPLMQAKFDFEPREKEDLEFKADDIIAIIDRRGDDWFYGYVHGKRGFIPSAYVRPY